jgi:hypothetical protein
MTAKKKKRPSDINLLAKSIVDEATLEPKKPQPLVPVEKNPAAVALGRLGGKKGGPARAKALSAEKRKEFARKAARARWGKKSQS